MHIARRVLFGVVALCLLAGAGCSEAESSSEGNAPSGAPPEESSVPQSAEEYAASPLPEDNMPSGYNWEVMNVPDEEGDGSLSVDVETPAETENEMMAVAAEVGDVYTQFDRITLDLYYHSGEHGSRSVFVGRAGAAYDQISGDMLYSAHSYLPEMEQSCYSSYAMGEDMTETDPNMGCWQWYPEEY